MGVNPLEASGASGMRFRAKHGIASDAPVILFMGSVTRDKGAIQALEAMRMLWRAGCEARLVLAGPVPEPGGFRQAFDKLEASDRALVSCVGILTGMEKQDAFAAATIFVLPSRVDSFGIVFLEAWMHGKPVIGAAAGGIPDVIRDGEDGFVVEFGSPKPLFERINLLLDRPEMAAAFGESGRKKTMAQYTWDAVYQRWISAAASAYNERV
jgi:glycosyltransferase involved in cell wall biosynthesis